MADSRKDKGLEAYLDRLSLASRAPEVDTKISKPQAAPGAIGEEDIRKLFEAYKPPPPDTEASYLETAAKKRQRIKYRTMLELGYGSGLRIDELVNVRIEDIDFKARRVLVRHGKGDKSRVVPVTDAFLDSLNDWLDPDIRPDIHGNTFLFPSRTSAGGHIVADAYFKHLREVAEKQGVKTIWNNKIGPHSLRHSFATHLSNGGMNILYISHLLGHSDLSSTQRYITEAGIDIEGIREDAEKLFRRSPVDASADKSSWRDPRQLELDFEQGRAEELRAKSSTVTGISASDKRVGGLPVRENVPRVPLKNMHPIHLTQDGIGLLAAIAARGDAAGNPLTIQQAMEKLSKSIDVARFRGKDIPEFIQNLDNTIAAYFPDGLPNHKTGRSISFLGSNLSEAFEKAAFGGDEAEIYEQVLHRMGILDNKDPDLVNLLRHASKEGYIKAGYVDDLEKVLASYKKNPERLRRFLGTFDDVGELINKAKGTDAVHVQSILSMGGNQEIKGRDIVQATSDEKWVGDIYTGADAPARRTEVRTGRATFPYSRGGFDSGYIFNEERLAKLKGVKLPIWASLEATDSERKFIERTLEVANRITAGRRRSRSKYSGAKTFTRGFEAGMDRAKLTQEVPEVTKDQKQQIINASKELIPYSGGALPSRKIDVDFTFSDKSRLNFQDRVQELVNKSEIPDMSSSIPFKDKEVLLSDLIEDFASRKISEEEFISALKDNIPSENEQRAIRKLAFKRAIEWLKAAKRAKTNNLTRDGKAIIAGSFVLPEGSGARPGSGVIPAETARRESIWTGEHGRVLPEAEDASQQSPSTQKKVTKEDAKKAYSSTMKKILGTAPKALLAGVGLDLVTGIGEGVAMSFLERDKAQTKYYPGMPEKDYPRGFVNHLFDSFIATTMMGKAKAQTPTEARREKLETFMDIEGQELIPSGDAERGAILAAEQESRRKKALKREAPYKRAFINQ